VINTSFVNRHVVRSIDAAADDARAPSRAAFDAGFVFTTPGGP
jgi:hypothetical protein